MAAADIFRVAAKDESFTRYAVEIQLHDKIVGGIPKDPDTIKKWLQSRLEMDDRAIIELATETQAAMEEAEGVRPSADDLVDAVARTSVWAPTAPVRMASSS